MRRHILISVVISLCCSWAGSVTGKVVQASVDSAQSSSRALLRRGASMPRQSPSLSTRRSVPGEPITTAVEKRNDAVAALIPRQARYGGRIIASPSTATPCWYRLEEQRDQCQPLSPAGSRAWRRVCYVMRFLTGAIEEMLAADRQVEQYYACPWNQRCAPAEEEDGYPRIICRPESTKSSKIVRMFRDRWERQRHDPNGGRWDARARETQHTQQSSMVVPFVEESP